MNFYNIFEKKDSKKEIEEKIIIDFRENNSLVPSELITLGIKIETRELKIGDYQIKNIIVERKTILDLISSLIDKRIFKQLEEIKKYPNYLLIIEGNFENLENNRIKGFLISCALKYKVPIIFSKNERDTANYLRLLLNKKEKVFSLKEYRRASTPNQELEYVLESFPKIGPVTSKKLLNKFKSLKNIFNSSEKGLEEILGKNVNLFLELINRDYN